ncbi:flagellar basal body-associated FliL family protein [Chromatium okenii]|jgi:flagellar FliL protein|uniref:Flagellar protein FliL n=1 Tax=Chromatium okenii TaxID=61644 RepID=A0A2S7XNV2_9GAMM|nr:flagellar basal body-associated FliL family protein [Chromatium okenii]MBV5308637.1 flagellar basal body-associated FliL family protein [Chromatium okenii]PQJ95253.1 flagellar basal body protein FliL [Chromatium okenii]
MAKKPSPAPETKTEEVSNNGKLKLILLIVGIVLVLFVGAGAAYYFLIYAPAAHSEVADDANHSETAPTTDEHAAASNEHPIDQVPVIYHAFDPITVNIAAGGPGKYLRISIVVVTRTTGVITALDKNLPMIRNDLLIRLSGQSYSVLNSTDGKNALREDLKKMLTDILMKAREPADIQDILFTDMVMQ